MSPDNIWCPVVGCQNLRFGGGLHCFEHWVKTPLEAPAVPKALNCARCLGKLQTEEIVHYSGMCWRCRRGDPVPVSESTSKAVDALLGTAPIKHDQGKVRTDLIPVKPLLKVAEALTHGAAKYGDFNYRNGKGMNWMRLYGACLRHVFAWATGEDNDKDSGLPHLSHACACLLMIADLQTDGHGVDDREKRP